MSNSIDPQKLNGLSGAGLTEEMKKAIKNKDASALMSQLSDSERQFLDTLMKDKEARDNLLSSPKLKTMLDSLLNGR